MGDSLVRERVALCSTPAGTWALNCENYVLNKYKLCIHLAQVLLFNASFVQKTAGRSHSAFVHCKVQMPHLLLGRSYFSEIFRRKKQSVFKKIQLGSPTKFCGYFL